MKWSKTLEITYHGTNHAVNDNNQSPNTIWPIIFTSPVTYLRAIDISKIDIGRSRSHEPINHIRKRPLPVSFEEQVVESLHKVEFWIQFALPSLHQNTTTIILIMHISKWSMQSSAKFGEEQTSPNLWQCTNAQQNKEVKFYLKNKGGHHDSTHITINVNFVAPHPLQQLLHALPRLYWISQCLPIPKYLVYILHDHHPTRNMRIKKSPYSWLRKPEQS